jgi:hypothetical protein
MKTRNFHVLGFAVFMHCLMKTESKFKEFSAT